MINYVFEIYKTSEKNKYACNVYGATVSEIRQFLDLIYNNFKKIIRDGHVLYLYE